MLDHVLITLGIVLVGEGEIPAGLGFLYIGDGAAARRIGAGGGFPHGALRLHLCERQANNKFQASALSGVCRSSRQVQQRGQPLHLLRQANGLQIKLLLRPGRAAWRMATWLSGWARA